MKQPKWKKILLVGMGLSLALLGTGCTSDEEAAVAKTVKTGEKITVKTVLQAQADFVREIGKDKVDVEAFVPPGTNFWQWAPIIAETNAMAASDMLVINGANIEERWLEQTKATIKLKNKDLVLVDPSEGIERLKLQRFMNPDAPPEEQKKERDDPFFYLDPQHAKKEVDNILAGLIKKAPDYAEEFRKNADAYKGKLDELDKKYADTLSKVKRRELVSPYPGYQYLAKRYGLSYYVPTSITYNDYPWDDPAKHAVIQEDFAKHDMKTVFFEQEAAPRVQEFLGKLGYKARILETYEGRQAVGDTYKSYIQIMEQNLGVLAEALNE